MKRNNKGFTLIELLAVIVILGLLMAIAIPSVTRYITQSRKKTLVSTMDSYVTAVTTAVNDNKFGALSKEDTMYYIPVSDVEGKSCVFLEKGGTNSFGNWKEAYVVVNYDSTSYSYDYYFTFYDDAGYGMALTKIDDINILDSVISNPTPVDSGNITTQTNNRVSKIEILVTGTCNVANTIAGSNNEEDNIVKVTTLAGTTWKMNDAITNYSHLETFDYDTQSGWEFFPSGSFITNGSLTYNFWGIDVYNIFGYNVLNTVHSLSQPLILSYIPKNNLNIDAGWYVVEGLVSIALLNGTITDINVIYNAIEESSAPTITFSSTTNITLENTDLINFMYENAVMQ